MACYLPIDSDKITVKTSTIESVIDFINNGEFEKALEYLNTIIDFDFRADVKRRKAELEFLINGSVTSSEHGKWVKMYDDLVKNCLF